MAEGDARHLLVKVQYPHGPSVDAEPTTLLLQVPLQASLDIDSVAADIDIDGVAPGDLQIDSVSGDIVNRGGAAARAHRSVSGDQRRPSPAARGRKA